MSTIVIKKKKWYFSLWFWVLIFMCGGIAFGVTSPNLAKQGKPVIDYFIHVIKLMVGPIIFFTVVSGVIGMGSLKQLGTIGIKAFIYFEIISTISLIIGLSFGHLFHPGSGMNLSASSIDPTLIDKYTHGSAQATSFSSILLSAIPHDIIEPFLIGNTLQILFMAICAGFILFYAGVCILVK